MFSTLYDSRCDVDRYGVDVSKKLASSGDINIWFVYSSVAALSNGCGPIFGSIIKLSTYNEPKIHNLHC